MRSRRPVDERVERIEGALLDAMATVLELVKAMKRRHEERDRTLDAGFLPSLGRVRAAHGGHELVFLRVGQEIHVSEDGVADARRVRFDDDLGGCRWFRKDGDLDVEVGAVAEVAQEIVGAWEKQRFPTPRTSLG